MMREGVRRAGAAFFVSLLALRTAAAQTPAPSHADMAAADPAKKEEAQARFKAGLDHFDRQEWSAALAEFLKSRELYPTRAATKNAAICFRKEGRFDEALEMYEELLRRFSELSPQDKEFAEREMQELAGSLGTIDIRGAEPGASIVVDGRARGSVPPPGPLRVSAGTHVVRVFKEGFLPSETRVDVAGRQAVVVNAHLGALLQGGRLRVAEQSGRALDVVVDGVAVGKTPWEGALAVGEHTLVLHGDGSLGTQPASAPVRQNQLTSLTLIAEELDAVARVEPTPAGAVVSIDGVAVGRGVWEGKLRAGGHLVEVASEGFLAMRRELALDKDARKVIEARLERDPASSLWAAQYPSRFVVELAGSAGLVPLFGGDVVGGCSGSCSQSLPFLVRGVFHGGYELGSGLGFAVDAGYLDAFLSTRGRATSLKPVGALPTNPGSADDDLRLAGLTLGVSASYHRGERWPVTLRLGVGVLLGSMRDQRSGTFTNSLGDRYAADVTASDSAVYLCVVPEARIGRRLNDHLELSFGFEAQVLAALHTPVFPGSNTANAVLAGRPPSQGDGDAFFANESLAGTLLLAIAPSLAVRNEF